MSTDLPPAGWYPNPDGTGGLRWWSGVGWTEYTRGGVPPAPAPAEADAAATEASSETAAPAAIETEPGISATDVPPATEPDNPWVQQTEQLAEPQQTAQAPPADQPPAGEPVNPWTQPTQQLGGPQPTTQVPQQPTNPWAQPNWAGQQAAATAYAPYQPPPKAPLTASGMRPLSGMFADIGRIVRRAWLPILGISIALWAVVSVIYIAVLLTTINLDALQRAFDLLGNADTNPETGLPSTGTEISAAFRDAFSALSPAGWALVVTGMTVLLLVATCLQTAAVNRLAMDAASGQPVSWAAGWKSGFTAGWRLFGYYLLIGLVFGLVWTAAVAVVVALWSLSPALSTLVGLLGFVALMVVSVFLTGRLIPITAQVVVGRRAISWSWQHTKGKFWGVLGRYLLWSLAASVIVNIIVSVVSIPASLLFLGSASSASSSAQLGASAAITLITLPVTMALSAVTFMGIVPIWRDLTDHPVYRSIDEQGLPIVTN